MHQRIAQAIRSVREGRLTAQQLAEETERLGHSISRSQIANYESGRKQSLDVAELLVIAAALGVSPLSLLFPGEPDDQVEMLPNRQTPTFSAKAWFSGDLGIYQPAGRRVDGAVRPDRPRHQTHGWRILH